MSTNDRLEDETIGGAAVPTLRRPVLAEAFQPPPSLTEAIFRSVGRAIVEGRLRPKQRLVETELCAEFGCSRSPVREAIRMLAAEGLVSFTPRRGVRVVELTPKRLSDVFEVRVLLEGLAARLAAQHRSQGDIEELQSLSQHMRRVVETGEHNEFFVHNNSFHELLGRIAGNDFLTFLQKTAANRTFLPLFLFLSDSEHLAAAVRAHEEIVNAVARGDSLDAEQCMQRHIRQIQREAEQIVTSRLGAPDASSATKGTVAERRLAD